MRQILLLNAIAKLSENTTEVYYKMRRLLKLQQYTHLLIYLNSLINVL